jgi:hypothetical protein
VIGASILVCTAPGLRTGLELEILWASTMGTRTEVALDLLLDVHNLAGLFQAKQSWVYLWFSCSHHPPLFDEKSSSASIVLEIGPAQHKGERGCKNKGNQKNSKEECNLISNFVVSVRTKISASM